MNDKNLINCLAQKQLKELDFEIKFNSSLKNKFNVGNSKNPFESNFATAPQNAFRRSSDLTSCPPFNYDKNANLIQKSDDPFEKFLNSSGGYQAVGSSKFGQPTSNLTVQNFSSFCPTVSPNNLTRSLNSNLPGNNWNQNLLANGPNPTNPTNFELSPQSNSSASNGNPSLFGHTALQSNRSSNQPFGANFLQSASASPANPTLNNFNPFLNYPTNQPNSQSTSHFNPNNSLNSTFSSTLSDDLSSSLNGFSLLSSNDFGSLLNAVPTNSLTKTLPSQSEVTNCDLINLDSSSGYQVPEDKYSIFKEIELSSDKNETKSNNPTVNPVVNADLSIGDKGDRLSSSADFGEDFGEFKSFGEPKSFSEPKSLGESFGEFKSYSDDFSSKSSSAKISECEKIARFEQLLSGVLSIFHRSFNVLNIYYDEKSVLTALSTQKGKEFYLDLREVYYVSKRIASGLSGMQSCEKLFNLIKEINNLWSLLDKMMSSLQV